MKTDGAMMSFYRDVTKIKEKFCILFYLLKFTFTECKSSMDNTKHQMIQKNIPRIVLGIGGEKKKTWKGRYKNADKESFSEYVFIISVKQLKTNTAKTTYI